jgi:putative glutamine amidotransferase
VAKPRKPLIGVTGPDRGGLAAWWFTLIAVHRAGGRAIRITPARPCAIARLDGLIIGGGADVDPGLYGAEERSSPEEFKKRGRALGRWLLSLVLFPIIYAVRRILSTMTSRPGGDTDRDELESALIREALQRELPILGICRGMQLLNVVCGGSLHQNIADFYIETPQIHTIWPYKPIRLEPHSRLARILGCTSCQVNSLHEQAIKDLAPKLQMAGYEPNGVVQAIEHTTIPFAIGVQWHPEYLPQRREQQAIFRRMVTAAVRRRQQGDDKAQQQTAVRWKTAGRK